MERKFIERFRQVLDRRGEVALESEAVERIGRGVKERNGVRDSIQLLSAEESVRIHLAPTKYIAML